MAWEYESKTWSALPSDNVPGPALSISTDGDTSIFISGLSSAGSTSYLLRWNGSAWSEVAGQARSGDQGSLELASSSLQQLLVTPVSSEVDSDYFSSNDRVLMVSGQLNLADSGPASTAIFDGNSWYPYLLSTTASGAAGSVAGFFYPASLIQFGRRRKSTLSISERDAAEHFFYQITLRSALSFSSQWLLPSEWSSSACSSL